MATSYGDDKSLDQRLMNVVDDNRKINQAADELKYRLMETVRYFIGEWKVIAVIREVEVSTTAPKPSTGETTTSTIKMSVDIIAIPEV